MRYRQRRLLTQRQLQRLLCGMIVEPAPGPPQVFRTLRLCGRATDPEALPLYRALFGDEGENAMIRDQQDWGRHGLARWVLSHAGRDVGVGGFHIRFGQEGLELSFHFLADVWGQGLGAEFVNEALRHAQLTLREQEIFAHVDAGPNVSRRLLEREGFADISTVASGQSLMHLSLAPT